MLRTAQQLAHARRLFAAAAGLLLILSLLPARWIAWVEWFRGPVESLVAPASHPVRAVVKWIAPATPRASDEALAALRDEAERFQTLYYRELDQTARLRETIAALQRGIQHAPDIPFRPLSASVIGASTDLTTGSLWVRAGRTLGVEENTVATVRGVQLLGRVVSTRDRTCQVRVITARGAGPIRGRVILDIDSTAGPLCQLWPTGDGTLRGPMSRPRAEPGKPPPPDPEPGMSVRLDDPDQWPANAHMLLVGRIEKVEPAPEGAGRLLLTVRPTVEKLERVSEVVLRIADDPAAAPGRREGAGP